MTAAWDVVVVGGGMAGLSAGRVLAESGLRVVLLEAGERLGGRILTLHPSGALAPVELGAEFIHGRPPELLALLAEAGLQLDEASGTNYQYAGGKLQPEPGRDETWALLDRLPNAEDPHGAAGAAADQSFDEWLATQPDPGQEAREGARQYVEGFNAASAARIGILGLAKQQAAEQAVEGHRSARVRRGYSALIDYQRSRFEAAGGVVRLGAALASVDWRPGEVHARTVQGDEWAARALLVAVPVGVLQSGSLRITPEPAQALAAARRIDPGQVYREVFVFRSRWWAARAPGLQFLFANGDAPLPVWWTPTPWETNLLVGWAGGPRAAQATSGSASPLRTLEQVFSLKPGALDRELVGRFHHDWQQDPYSRGAYSSLPAGSLSAPAELAAPVEHTLFFAGEHTDTTGHPGTVHGALRSGLRAAGQVLEVLAGRR